MNKPFSMLQHFKSIFTVSIILLCVCSTPVHAIDFGKLLNTLVQSQGETNSKGQVNANQAGRGAPGGGSSLTESYCRRMFTTAGVGKSSDVDQSVVLEEFNLAAPGDFFDAFSGSQNQGGATFPNPRFYQGEFETDRINVVYDLLLGYPSAHYVAALIHASRNDHKTPRYDHQEKVDALAALTIIHYHMRNFSRDPDRWKQLAARLQKEEHYTARVISARLLAFGEANLRDPDQALSYASEANNLRTKYREEQGYRTMSSRNYNVTSNRTVYDIVSTNPQSRQARYFIQFAQQYGANLKNPIVAPELERSLVPGLRSIEASASSAQAKALEMLGGAKEFSLLNAEKSSLDSATRNRVSDSPSDLNIDNKAMLAITRQMEKLTSLDDQQKQKFSSALVDARESGDKAIALMPQMFNSMMNLMMQRGIEYMPALVPYAMRLQYHSDNACSVFARWEQAAQVTKASTDNSRNALASLVGDSK
jgi:hypothetical protein